MGTDNIPGTAESSDALPVGRESSTGTAGFAVAEGTRRHRHRKPLAHRSRWASILLVGFGVLVVLAGAGIAALTWRTATVGGEVGRIADALPTGDRPAAAPDALTFLVMGTDSADAAADSPTLESLTLVRLTADHAHIQALSVPPDLWLDVPQGSGSTPERLFSTAGPQQLVAAVEAMSGVRVDHAVQLDFDGFRTVTDALGGVTVDVPEPYGHLGYDFSPGPQHLNGSAALAYVRDAPGDAASLTSATRQRLMTEALFDRVSDLGLRRDVGRLGGFIDSVTTTVSVDEQLDSAGLVRIAWDMRAAGRPDFVTLPTAGPGSEGGTPVRYRDEVRAAALWGYLRDDALADHLAEFR